MLHRAIHPPPGKHDQLHRPLGEHEELELLLDEQDEIELALDEHDEVELAFDEHDEVELTFEEVNLRAVQQQLKLRRKFATISERKHLVFTASHWRDFSQRERVSAYSRFDYRNRERHLRKMAETTHKLA